MLWKAAFSWRGAAIQWLRDELRLIRSAAAIRRLLRRQCRIRPGAYVVPAFTGLGAPHWDPYARGTIVGITRGFDRRTIWSGPRWNPLPIRPADVLAAMEKDSGIGP